MVTFFFFLSREPFLSEMGYLITDGIFEAREMNIFSCILDDKTELRKANLHAQDEYSN